MQVNKEGNQFVGKLLQESAECLTQTIDRLQSVQKPSRASGAFFTMHLPPFLTVLQIPSQYIRQIVNEVLSREEE
jgi:hypothetical protein